MILVKVGSTESDVDRVSEPASEVTATKYVPALANCTLVRTSVELVAPGILTLPNLHWYVPDGKPPVATTRKVTLAPRLTDGGVADACATVNVTVSLGMAPAALATTTA